MKRLIFIVVLPALAIFVVWPQRPGNYIPGGDALPGNPGIHLGSFTRQGAKLGLDLQGGTQLTLQSDMSQIADDQKENAMKGLVNVIQKRVNAYGVAEAEIQTRGTDRLIVQLPGVKDIEEAKKLFGQITQRLVQKPLGIFLDGQQISAPTVQAVLTQNGIITGLSLDQARLLALELNAGALPVPVSVQEERTVDATLGADSVHKSIVAGEVALIVVVAFMLMYYRLPGLAASSALIVYSLVALAIFKLIPVTLTLAGIAGFILSVGMAVDANILIFERMKEELRSGKTIT